MNKQKTEYTAFTLMLLAIIITGLNMAIIEWFNSLTLPLLLKLGVALILISVNAFIFYKTLKTLMKL